MCALASRSDGDSETVKHQNGHVLATSDHQHGYQCYLV